MQLINPEGSLLINDFTIVFMRIRRYFINFAS
jgi:hypothetical protein